MADNVAVIGSKPDVSNIPHMLREYARRIDAGEVLATNAVIVFNDATNGLINVRFIGEDASISAAMGLLHYAAGILFAGRDV